MTMTDSLDGLIERVERAGGLAGKLFDKHGIPIERGDIVKVFHFVGARNKRHYMYKQCLGIATYPSGSKDLLFFSHLNFNDAIGGRDGPYHERPDGRVMAGYEVVQSIACDHATRIRFRALQSIKTSETPT